MASTARLDELKKKFDENPRRYFAPLANEHRKSGDLDQAISLCRAHLPQQPAHISGHIVLAQALFEAGSIDEAREIFMSALGLDPENLIALRYLGDIAREAEDMETARSWYQRVLEVDPRNDEIEQLVRDLDAPRATATTDGDPATPTEAPTAPVVATPPIAAPRPAPVANDARFAPLSLDELDIDGHEPSTEQRDGQAAAPASATSLDAHSPWAPQSPTGAVPMMDEPELDPFDLHPSASAESLFDAGAQPSTDDFFLTDMSGANAPVDGAEPDAPYRDVWASAATEEMAAASAPTSESEPETFEAGAFYLEPAPSAPGDAVAEVPATDAPRPEDSTPVTASTDAAVHAPPTPDDASIEPPVVAERDPNAEAMALFADSQTAEWEPPRPPVVPNAGVSANETLGLEVMEFVPPSSEAAPSSVPAAHPDMDPWLGRTPEPASAEQGTPAAFVTETMAELYLQQGFRNEALAVYRELLARNPADSSLRDRIDQIESGSMSSIGMAMLSENVVESALKRQTARPTRSVRSFFASLAGRRAPAAPSRAESTPDVAEPMSHEPSPSDLMFDEPVMPSESAALPEPPDMPEPAAELDASPRANRITPLASAAETLATYDPFGEKADPVLDTADSSQPDVPNVPPPSSPPGGAPEMSSGPAAANAYTVAPAAPTDPAAVRRSLEDLFPDTPVTARTEAAAQTLATAFGRDEPQGRPTRAASNELSLDHVFRGSPEGPPASDGGFSFDQFFSDARPGGGDGSAAPTVSAPDTGRSMGSSDAHDIEQFTAWLEGLKKK